MVNAYEVEDVNMNPWYTWNIPNITEGSTRHLAWYHDRFLSHNRLEVTRSLSGEQKDPFAEQLEYQRHRLVQRTAH